MPDSQSWSYSFIPYLYFRLWEPSVCSATCSLWRNSQLWAACLERGHGIHWASSWLWGRDDHFLLSYPQSHSCPMGESWPTVLPMCLGWHRMHICTRLLIKDILPITCKAPTFTERKILIQHKIATRYYSAGKKRQGAVGRKWDTTYNLHTLAGTHTFNHSGKPWQFLKRLTQHRCET